jgi:Tfp pilus assembly protein PilZ
MTDKIFHKRANLRAAVDLKVLFKIKGKESHTEARVTNFSHNGLFITTSIIPTLNKEIEMLLFLPEEQNPISIKGEVTSIPVDRAKFGEGMGIRIIKESISSGSKEKLKEFFDAMHIYGWFC